MELSNKNVQIAGFGMDCFSVIAPEGCDVEKLKEFLLNSNACQREVIEYSYTYKREDGACCFVFSESGGWKF